VVKIIIIISLSVCVCLSAFYVDRAATDAGTVADMAATRKKEKGLYKLTRPYLQHTGSSL